jgi:uncharacterized membrane protein YphA (DoxX/SURF4 family)
MKKTKIFYWIFTGLLIVLMAMSSIPNIMSAPEAVSEFARLGYPTYLLPFIGVAKLLGVIAILMPGLSRIKEWAYAGFVFDLAELKNYPFAQGTRFIKFIQKYRLVLK